MHVVSFSLNNSWWCIFLSWIVMTICNVCYSHWVDRVGSTCSHFSITLFKGHSEKSMVITYSFPHAWNHYDRTLRYLPFTTRFSLWFCCTGCPCTLREQLNEWIKDIVNFHAYEHTYDMKIEKNREQLASKGKSGDVSHTKSSLVWGGGMTFFERRCSVY
jgi:hypothetical protein